MKTERERKRGRQRERETETETDTESETKTEIDLSIALPHGPYRTPQTLCISFHLSRHQMYLWLFPQEYMSQGGVWVQEPPSDTADYSEIGRGCALLPGPQPPPLWPGSAPTNHGERFPAVMATLGSGRDHPGSHTSPGPASTGNGALVSPSAWGRAQGVPSRMKAWPALL